MTFYRLQLTILRNLLQALGPRISLLLLGLATPVLYAIGHLPPPEIVGICMAMIVGIHLNRGDKPLLQLLYHGRQRRLLMAEYAVLSLPFVSVCLLNGHPFTAAVCIGLSTVVPFMPHTTVALRPVTHPLLPRGSCQYRNTMRILLAPYLAGIVVSGIGLVYGNPKIL